MTESVFFGRNLSKKADFAKFARIFEPSRVTQKTNKVRQITFFAIISCVTAAVCEPPKRFIPDNAAIEREMRFYKSLGEPYISLFACYLGEDYRVRYGVPDFSALKNFVKNKRA